MPSSGARRILSPQKVRVIMIGFDIGGTKCAITVGEECGGQPQILRKKVLPTDLSIPPEEMLLRMCRAAEEMTEDFSAVGISCGGPLDGRRGLILSPPNLPGWDAVPVVELLRRRWGCSAVLQNDANACALAEWKWGAGKGTENMVFLTFGTGMGAGLILGGRLYEGTSSMAGEVGHIRLSAGGPVGYGKAGSFEGFCSGGGIAALGRSMAEDAFRNGSTVSFCASPDQLSGISAKGIAAEALSGSADALEVYRICGEKLGEGLSVLIDILNPEVIVIGSIFVRVPDLLIPSMQKAIDAEALLQSRSVCRVVPAALGESLGDFAALSCAAEAEKAALLGQK